MKTWNHAKPWAYHSHAKPYERWGNMTDPAYMDQNWLEDASAELPLNPLKQSFVNNRVLSSEPLPGMQPSWLDLNLAQRTGETRDFPGLQANMQAWSIFYNTIHDESTAYMECAFQMLASCTEEQLDIVRQWSVEQCTNEFGTLFRPLQGTQFIAKPGIGTPQVPQNEFDMVTGVYFRPPGVTAAPLAAPITMPATATATTSSSQKNGQGGTAPTVATDDQEMIDHEEEANREKAHMLQGVNGFAM